MTTLLDKETLRTALLRRRGTLPRERRVAAAQRVTERVLEAFPDTPCILSFASIASELDTSTLNATLAQQGRLLLPRVGEQDLHLHHVDNPTEQLVKGTWGIAEPNPMLCPEVALEGVSVILVPGLAFDNNHHRLGYGKGYYDRLLAGTAPNTTVVGIGFQEQLLNTTIPTEPHDIALNCLFLG